MCHVLFISSSVDAVITMGMQTFLCESALNSFGCILQVELLGPMVTLFLIFLETAISFSIVVLPFYTPNSSAQELQVLHIITNTCYFLFAFLNSSHPNVYEMIFYWGFFAFF